MGYNALQSGFAQSPRGIGILVGMPIAGMLTSRIESRTLIAGGMVLIAVAAWMMSNIDLEVAKRSFILSNVIQGFGLSITFVPLAAMYM